MAWMLVLFKAVDEHDLAFRTLYGIFKPIVLRFGTMKDPVDFHGYIKITIWEAWDDLAFAYLDNI